MLLSALTRRANRTSIQSKSGWCKANANSKQRVVLAQASSDWTKKSSKEHRGHVGEESRRGKRPPRPKPDRTVTQAGANLRDSIAKDTASAGLVAGCLRDIWILVSLENTGARARDL